MRFCAYLIAGILATCPQAGMAEEPPGRDTEGSGRVQAGKREKTEAAGETGRPDKPGNADPNRPIALPQEIEDIRRALGPDYSVDSWQPEVRQPLPPSGDAGPPGSRAGPWNGYESKLSEEHQALAREIRALGSDFRKSARRLESLAAEAEEQELYHLADRLRDLARREWESAREVTGPAVVSPPQAYPTPYYGQTIYPAPSRYPPPYSSGPTPFPGWNSAPQGTYPGQSAPRTVVPPRAKPHVDGPP